MQRAKYDIGEEAVHRFSLSAEDKATLELAEWVDSAVRRASVRFRILYHMPFFYLFFFCLFSLVFVCKFLTNPALFRG